MSRLTLYFLSSIICLSCSNETDREHFSDPQWITIAGQVLNPAPDISKVELAIRRLAFRTEALETEIDHEGNFKFQFEAYTPTDVCITTINADTNPILSEVVRDHIGMPIYVDIWATWCQPCLRQFRFCARIYSAPLYPSS